MLWRRSFALFVALLALAAPATSFAQSAGQDQYQDPLAGGNGGSGGSTGGGSTGGGSTGGGSTSTTGSGTTGTGTAPASTAPGTTAGTGTTTSAPTASGAQAGQLPNTGFDVIVTFELGLAMLLLGLVSHRLLVLRDRR